MKRLGLLALLIANSSAHATDFAQGLYAGILLGASYSPSTWYFMPAEQVDNLNTLHDLVLPDSPLTLDGIGKVSHGYLGQIAGQVGYRFCGKYRVEGQIAYNNTPINSLTFGDLTLDGKTHEYYNFKGNIDTLIGMVNGYYDFMPSDPRSYVAPYVGIGIGYISSSSLIDINGWARNPNVPLGGEQIFSAHIKDKLTSPAGQIILGTNIFLDDFSSFGLDIRYLTSATASTATDARLQIYSLNLTFNGAFNLGA